MESASVFAFWLQRVYGKNQKSVKVMMVKCRRRKAVKGGQKAVRVSSQAEGDGGMLGLESAWVMGFMLSLDLEKLWAD